MMEYFEQATIRVYQKNEDFPQGYLMGRADQDADGKWISVVYVEEDNLTIVRNLGMAENQEAALALIYEELKK